MLSVLANCLQLGSYPPLWIIEGKHHTRLSCRWYLYWSLIVSSLWKKRCCCFHLARLNLRVISGRTAWKATSVTHLSKLSPALNMNNSPFYCLHLQMWTGAEVLVACLWESPHIDMYLASLSQTSIHISSYLWSSFVYSYCTSSLLPPHHLMKSNCAEQSVILITVLYGALYF